MRLPLTLAGLSLLALTTGGHAQTGLVVAASAGQLTLSWGDNSTEESGFTIERSLPNDVCEFAPVGTTPANTETWVDTPLATGVRWCYRVRAFNDGGASPPSNVACGTVADATPPPPTSASATFIRTSKDIQPPFSVTIGAYTCERLVGGTAEARIYQGTTYERASLANPPLGVPFTITCTIHPTTVTFTLNSVVLLTAPR